MILKICMVSYRNLDKGEHKMNFDKWFEGQEKIIQVILLIIPFVGWVVEILYRLSKILRKPSVINIAGGVIFAVIGLAWVGLVLDVIFLFLNNRLCLVED